MFRELTKSAMSLSWALSLLGLKQAFSLARPNQQNSGSLFAPMTQAAVGQLDESMKGIYRAGESMGSRAIDMAFTGGNPLNWLNPGAGANMSSWMNPATWIDPSSWMRSVTNMTQAATGCCGQGVRPGQQPSASTSPSPPPPASQPSAGPVGGSRAPVSNESAAAGWGPMPGTS